ncbi:MAG: EAL domain-containing protein [Cocleimonas sp.]|nr:EAL domain-containing protein [Cocleimonas sp.]
MEYFSSYSGLLLALLLASVLTIGWFLFRWKKSAVIDKAIIDYKQDVFRIIPYPIVLLNKKEACLYINPAAEKILKLKLRQIIGKDYKNIFSLLDSTTDLPLTNFQRLAEDEHWKECELKLTLDDEKIMVTELSVIPMRYDYQQQVDDIYVLSLKDITHQRALEIQLSLLEKRDGLTHLHNRKAFEIVLTTVINDSRKHGATHVFFYLSIDQFRNIKDSIGSTDGDELIKGVAKLLRQNIQHIDIVARLNIDEFGILFREKNILKAIKIMKFINQQIDEFNFIRKGMTYPITVSGGFVLVDKNSNSAAQVLSEGDLTCRIARKKGGGRILAYREDNADIQQAQDNLKGVWNLKQAFKDNRFSLFAQPIHPLAPKKYALAYSHYEILIRMYDEEGNIVPPDEFIPIAENYSMMPTLDRWVVREAIRQLKAVTQMNPIPVFAINLSGTSLDDERFLPFVLEEIESAGIDPRMLCFEITEQIAVSNLQLAEKFIETLRLRGSSFSLDDFGTGVSSYGYLRSLNVDYLKIDGIFIKDILSDDITQAMVKSIVQVGHRMGLKIIAEYVENEQIIEWLRKISIDYGQGYGIAKPEPLSEMIKPHC